MTDNNISKQVTFVGDHGLVVTMSKDMDKLPEKMIHKKIEIDLSEVSEKDKKIYIDKLMKKAKELNLAYIVINDIKK